MNTTDFKVGVCHDIASLRVPFQDGQVREAFIRRCDGDGAASVDGGLIDVRKHRLVQFGPRRRRGHLDEGVHPLFHVRNRDGAVLLGGLGTNNLAVPQDIKNSAGEGIVGIIQFDELDLHLGVVLEN